MTRSSQVGANASDYILPLGILGGLGLVGYLIYKGLLSPGSGGSGQANQQAQTAIDQGTAATAAQQQAKGEKQFISPVLAASVANQIYAISTSDESSAEQIANLIINNVLNLTDLNAVIAAFGTRAASTSWLSTCQWLNFNCPNLDLASFVKLALNDYPDELQALNGYLSSMQINFQF